MQIPQPPLRRSWAVSSTLGLFEWGSCGALMTRDAASPGHAAMLLPAKTPGGIPSPGLCLSPSHSDTPALHTLALRVHPCLPHQFNWLQWLLASNPPSSFLPQGLCMSHSPPHLLLREASLDHYQGSHHIIPSPDPVLFPQPSCPMQSIFSYTCLSASSQNKGALLVTAVSSPGPGTELRPTKCWESG